MRESNEEMAERLRMQRKVDRLRGAACAKCVYFVAESPPDVWWTGRCHQPSPTVEHTSQRWPRVESDEWCGFYLPDPEKVAEVERREEQERQNAGLALLAQMAVVHRG